MQSSKQHKLNSASNHDARNKNVKSNLTNNNAKNIATNNTTNHNTIRNNTARNTARNQDPNREELTTGSLLQTDKHYEDVVYDEETEAYLGQVYLLYILQNT